MTEKFSICVDQSLHGYDEGHRLLAASRRFAPAMERELRTLSDLSGPTTVSGFQEYLTGYALPEDQSYAIAKTWLANEMPRVGCVWTHTLLFKNEDICHLQDLLPILDLFQRPSLFSANAYKLPIEIDLEPKQQSFGHSETDVTYVAPIIEKLYNSSESVYICTHRRELIEPSVFAVWAQYKSLTGLPLSFCTGAIRPRNAFNRSLDIQIISAEAERDLVRSAPGAAIMRFLPDKEIEVPSRWCTLLARDAVKGPISDIYNFVKLYSLGVERRDIGELARLYTAISSLDVAGGKFEKLFIKLVALAGRGPGNDLLIDVIGSPQERKFLRSVDEIDLLRAILNSSLSPFQKKLLNLPKRLIAACVPHPELLKSAIKEMIRLGAFARESLAELLMLSTDNQPSDLLRGLSEDEAVALLSLRPELALLPLMWTTVDPDSIAEYIVSSHPMVSDISVRRIIDSVISNRTGRFSTAIDKAFGGRAVAHVLDWLEAHPQVSVGVEWLQYVGRWSKHATKWLRDNQDADIRVVHNITSALDRGSIYAARLPIKFWHNALARLCTLDSEKQRNLSCLVLSLGLRRGTKSAARLVAATFSDVHGTIINNSIDSLSWSYLDDVLPDRLFWDPAKRLRVGVVRCFVDNKWPPLLFVRTVDAETLEYVLRSWGWDAREMRFLRALFQISKSGGELSADKAEVLDRFAEWFST